MIEDEKLLVAELKQRFPSARPRLIELAVEAISLHADKNNDYHGGGSGGEFASLGLVGRLHDLTRKIGRLHNFIVRGGRQMTKENLRDTSLDLAVYALLMTEDLEREK